jgi:hypothetical protein
MRAPDLTTLVFQLAISLCTAVVGALLAVRLALRRYYQEKWWDAKMRAYTEIIEALHHITRDVDISLDAAYSYRDTDTPFHKEWDSKHRAAWDNIRKFADVGEFLFSAHSMTVLGELLKAGDAGPNADHIAELEGIRTAVEKCLPAIKASARADLNLASR